MQTMKANLTSSQISDRDFLCDLSYLLSRCDLSGTDIQTHPGKHRAYNVLFDNYELYISRTGVYVYRNGFLRALGFGKWKFQDDVFERYEICISENRYDMRSFDIMRMVSSKSEKISVPIIQCATMATDFGCFPYSYRDLEYCDTESYSCANTHLFKPAKQIYNIIDTEHLRRNELILEHKLPEIKTPKDLDMARNRLLCSVKSRIK